MKTIVVIGTAWGDEGKGKITDFLAAKADVVARFQGGNNAGHTVIVDGKHHLFQLLPSGVINPKTTNLLTNGMVIDPKGILEEIDELGKKDLKLFISNRAHVVMPYHLAIESANERRKGDKKLQTTGHGIGPTYSDKANRIGLRMEQFVGPNFKKQLENIINLKNLEADKLGIPRFNFKEIYEEYKEYAKRLKPHVIDTSLYLNEQIEKGKKVLFEGAQGVMLCLENGTYPFVTSSSPTAAAVPLYAGIAPWLLEGAVGVVKAYATREGAGPMPTLIPDDKIQAHFHKTKVEYEPRTKTYRRVGWLDTVILRHAKRVSGLTYLAVTVLDILSGLDELKICTSYNLNGEVIDYIPADINEYEKVTPNFITLPGWKEDISHVSSYEELPENAKKYLEKIEKLVGVEIGIFSVGPAREQTIQVKDFF
ncbi:MAG: adenylosuccinate synthase [Acholeplasmataceae bacterium]|jgi:adenylosuccinate synthase